MMAFVISNNDVSGYNFNDLAKTAGSKVCILSGNAGNNKHVFSRNKISMAKLLGQRNLDSDPTFYSAVTTNPADVVYFTIGATSTTSANVSVDLFIQLKFHCKFKNKKSTATPSLTSVAERSLLTATSSKETPVPPLDVLKLLAELDEKIAALRLVPFSQDVIESLTQCIRLRLSLLDRYRVKTVPVYCSKHTEVPNLKGNDFATVMVKQICSTCDQCRTTYQV